MPTACTARSTGCALRLEPSSGSPSAHGPRSATTSSSRRADMTLFAETLPVDHDVRERVRTDLDRNLFVEAGAGTGKTRVLVDRVVRLVASGTVSDISRLVAITFTEAAAAELRDRIRTELERAADAGLPDDERMRCATARTHIDRATITTLHGFAQRILAEHPLDAGLAPIFEIDDDVQSRVRFVERWMQFRDD